MLKKGMQSIQRIFPKGLPSAIGPYSPVTIMGSTVFISGQIPINPQTNKIDCDDIQGQTHQVMKNLKSALDGVQLGWNNVAKTSILLTDMSNFAKVNQIYSSYFQKGQYPARVCFAVKGLPRDSLVQIDAIVYKPQKQEENTQDVIKKKVKLNEQQ